MDASHSFGHQFKEKAKGSSFFLFVSLTNLVLNRVITNLILEKMGAGFKEWT
jgi:hypothetical protein